MSGKKTSGNKQAGDRQAGDKQADGGKAWARVKQKTSPLSTAQRDFYTPSPDAPKKAISAKTPKAAPKEKPPTLANPANPESPPARQTAQQTERQTAHQSARRTGSAVAAIDTKSKRRLARGGLALDGRLDLHGLTLREAEAALRGFVARAAAQNHVWLLVITGKGARGEGKLRAAFPDWLAAPELSAHVAAYSPAGAAHGGGGAFYLRLRKARRLF